MTVPKLNIFRKMTNETITDKMVQAECKKWGLDYPLNDQKEMNFIWQQLERMLSCGKEKK